MRARSLAATVVAIAASSFHSLLAFRSLAASPADSAPPSSRLFDVSGVVRSIDPAQHEATITHDAIDGYMPAMTMSFDAPTSSELQNLHPGDRIRFKLHIEGERAWIGSIQVVGPETPAVFSPPPASTARDLQPGDPVPDLPLKTSTGEEIPLSAMRGKALALTFIYTRCPLPTYCPLLSRNFQKAQELVEKLGVSDKCRFLSISLDPDHDDPKALAEYGARFGANPARWIFATAPAEKIRLFGSSIGLEYSSQGDQIAHNLRTVVIDSHGNLRRIFNGNKWTPQELAAELRAAH